MTFSQNQIRICTNLVIVVSTIILSLGLRGGVRVLSDSMVYIGGSVNLYTGRGYCIDRNFRDDFNGKFHFTRPLNRKSPLDSIPIRPINNFPPLTSICYSLFMLAGFSTYYAPAVLAIICWIFFLVGTAFLTQKLCSNRSVTFYAVVTAAITGSYFHFYHYAVSEVLFLPVMLWSMLFLIDYHDTVPRQDRFPSNKNLFIATLLLSLLPVIRYSGFLVCISVTVWCLVNRIAQKEFKRLLFELSVLSIYYIPFAFWLIRNAAVTNRMLGYHWHFNSFTFTQGILGIVLESIRVYLPSLAPERVIPALYAKFGLLFFLAPFVTMIVLLGIALKRNASHYRLPSKSPIPFFLILYLVFYTAGQKLFYFTVMDARYAMTALCLFHPWLFGSFINWEKRTHRFLLLSFVMSNIMLKIVWELYNLNWITL